MAILDTGLKPPIAASRADAVGLVACDERAHRMDVRPWALLQGRKAGYLSKKQFYAAMQRT
jgi:hypothetical protein